MDTESRKQEQRPLSDSKSEAWVLEQEIWREIRANRLRVLRTIGFGTALIIVGFVLNYTSDRTARRAETASEQAQLELAELRRTIATADLEATEFRHALALLNSETIQAKAALTNQQVDSLNRKIDDLEGRYAHLNSILNPTNSKEFLTVAQMEAEVKGRKEFQQTFEMKLTTIETRIDGINSRQWTLVYWVLGFMITLIGLLAGCIVKIFQDAKANKAKDKVDDKSGSAQKTHAASEPEIIVTATTAETPAVGIDSRAT